MSLSRYAYVNAGVRIMEASNLYMKYLEYTYVYTYGLYFIYTKRELKEFVSNYLIEFEIFVRN